MANRPIEPGIDHQDQQDFLWLGLVANGGRAGDKAMEQLFRRYRKPLLSFLLHRQADLHEAEDLVQETFLRVVRCAAGFRHECKVSSWLYGIARNLYLDRLRTPGKEDTVSDEDWETLENVVKAPPVCEAHSNQQAFQDCFDHAYATYAQAFPAAAEVLHQVAWLGWSSRDVAHFLQRTEGATREYISQCRKKLRQFAEPCRELLKDLP